MSDHYQEFIDNPTGAIPKGAWCDCCKRFNNRKITVSVVILDQKKERVVMIKRATQPQQGWWALPGGYLDWDETIFEAGAREVKEETGITVAAKELQLIGVFSSPNRDPDGRQNVDCSVWVQVADEVLEEMRAQEESSTVELVELSNLPDEIAFDHKAVISSCLNLM